MNVPFFGIIYIVLVFVINRQARSIIPISNYAKTIKAKHNKSDGQAFSIA